MASVGDAVISPNRLRCHFQGNCLPSLLMEPRSPQRIGNAHLADKLAYLQRNYWPATPRFRFPSPIQTEAGAMPFDHGLRLNNRQRIANAREKPIKANKNQAVDGAEGLFLRSGSSQNVYPLPQHPNFHLKRCPRPKQICDHPNNEPDKISHPARASPDSRSTAKVPTPDSCDAAKIRLYSITSLRAGLRRAAKVASEFSSSSVNVSGGMAQGVVAR
jgi:hypothetical protein